MLAALPDASLDLLFLDAERTEYPAWWPHPARVLRPGGVLVVDNALSHAGEVAPLATLVDEHPGLSATTVAVGKGELLADPGAAARSDAGRDPGRQRAAVTSAAADEFPGRGPSYLQTHRIRAPGDIMTTIAGTSTTARRPGRAPSVALWVGQILVAAALLFASIPKVTLEPMAVQGFAAIGFSPTGTLVIGLLEIAGVIGMLVPRLTGLAALCVVALMVGAVAFTIPGMGAAMAVLPAVIGVVAALVAYGRRHSTAELAARVGLRTSG